LVALELSSFQLENLGLLKRSPNISVVMNLTPNHLDRHGTMENYTEAKRQIVAHQGPADGKGLNLDDPIARTFAEAPASRTHIFTARPDVPGQNVTVIRDEKLILGQSAAGTLDVSRRKIPGAFNLQNMAAAASALWMVDQGGWGGWKAACEDVFNTFPG